MTQATHQRSIKVLHLTFNMGIGGTEEVIRQLVSNMQDCEIEHRILCIDGEIGPSGRALQYSGIDVQTLHRQDGLDWSLVQGIRRYLVREQIDLVHCHQYTPWTYGWLAHWRTGAKLVFTEHGRFHPDRHRKKAKWLNRLMALTTGAMIAISEATREALVRYEFLPRDRIRIIYNGLPAMYCTEPLRQQALRQLGLQADDQIIGTVARLDEVKNQALMIQATAELSERYPRLYLVLVGDGPARAQLRTLAKTLGISDRVRFTGFQETPAAFLSLMSIFLLTSRTEGTSMTLLEAMSLGIVPVVTAVGGNPEIVTSPDTGFVIPDDDGPALVAALDQLLGDPALRQKVGESARQYFMAHHEVHQMTTAYRACYRRLTHSAGYSSCDASVQEARHGDGT